MTLYRAQRQKKKIRREIKINECNFLLHQFLENKLEKLPRGVRGKSLAAASTSSELKHFFLILICIN